MGIKKLKNNWHVITGGPSTGKTTVINLLTKRGYHTAIEHARHYIDTLKIGGNTIEEIRKNERKFQLGILEMQIQQEKELSAGDTVFLDRAIPDAMAYFQFLKLDYESELLMAMEQISYKSVFILDRLPFVKDYARVEDEDAQKAIHKLIIDVYKSLGFPVIFVPVLQPEERVDYILNNI